MFIKKEKIKMIDSIFGVALEHVFFSLLLALSIAILLSQNLMHIAIYSSLFSIIMSIMYLLMAAPDVAMTESAIGAALSTVILIKAMQNTRCYIVQDNLYRIKNLISLVILILFGLMMSYVFMELPDYGQSYNPVSSYVSKYYIQNTHNEIGITSSVAAVLASYRGFDTLGETLVIMIAGLVIYCTTNFDSELKMSSSYQEAKTYSQHLWMTDYLRSIILPLSVMMAFYIQVHGEISPGGGFQAGAILASIYIFYYSLMNEQDENYILLIERLFKISCCGFLIYLAVGIYTAILGGCFLEYNFITGNILGQKIGIFFVEIGVGITVFSVLLMIFLILEVKLYKIMRL